MNANSTPPPPETIEESDYQRTSVAPLFKFLGILLGAGLVFQALLGLWDEAKFSSKTKRYTATITAVLYQTGGAYSLHLEPVSFTYGFTFRRHYFTGHSGVAPGEHPEKGDSVEIEFVRKSPEINRTIHSAHRYTTSLMLLVAGFFFILVSFITFFRISFFLLIFLVWFGAYGYKLYHNMAEGNLTPANVRGG